MVGVELALVVDVSSSVSANEYQLQRDGYAAAFQNAGLKQLIADTPGGVAVSYIEFSSPGFQIKRLGWTHLQTAAQSDAFGILIGALARQGNGSTTSITKAIEFATNQILNNDFDGKRKVIDVSGDGKDNQLENGGGHILIDKDNAAGFIATGNQTKAAALAAIAAGVTQVNGLPVITADVDDPNLVPWYNQYVLAGDSPLIFPANSFDDIAVTILEKITTEIDNPVPDTGTTAALLGFGLLALGAIHRRMKR